MNFFDGCATLSEDPREVFTGANSTAMRCTVVLPPVSKKKAPTQIELNIYGKTTERFSRLKKGNSIFIHDASIRYDLESKAFSLHGGGFAVVDAETFPILNKVVLSGRCVKNIDENDPLAFKTTANGLMICNQTLTISTGRNQADLFNFYAINNVDDKPNYAELLCNLTRKGTGLTLKGRLVTDSWIDKDTKEEKTQTKIELKKMTLGPRVSADEGANASIKPKANVASNDADVSLWGGRTADDQPDPWGQNESGLPDLPGQYGTPVDDDDNAPF